MLVLLVKFGKELVRLLLGVFGYLEHDAVISVLTLVDTADRRAAADHRLQQLRERR
jgi:hypothetical protein